MFGPFCAWICLVFLVGCSPKNLPTFPVSGSVEFEDGEPVRIGTIEFRQEASQGSNGERIMARGKISEDGTFTLTTFEPNDGAIEGAHQITIHQMVVVEDRSFKDHGHGRRVSPKYSDYASSGLSADIKAVPKSDTSTNRVKIQLKLDPSDKKTKGK